MSSLSIKTRVFDAMKTAMKARDQKKLGCIRLIQAAFKQIEVDERCEIDDARALSILDKMKKQRLESIKQYEQASRTDLADKEREELEVLTEFLPEPLSEDALKKLVEEAVSSTGASSVKDMGKVMGVLKPQVQGRADMGAVGAMIKSLLQS
ncbi:MAG: glutamyl-tRNA amidotransferase [Legionellales bacterium]|nr:glutamyl-tRNA amidotransferase [Legionellales bacterium]|tara:strand:- start:578 stop:1033 length:456 start_codon:yes stop_codon:yes gene_type:complete